MSDDIKMYQENILDHYKHPRNSGSIDHAQFHAHATNPLCGDELDFYLNFDNKGEVSEVKFTGRGCTISQASASLLTEKLMGMKKQEVLHLKNRDMVAMLGVEIVPARLKCATLSLETVQKAIGHH